MRRAALALCMALGACGGEKAPPGPAAATIGAAASLRNAMPELVLAFGKRGEGAIKVSYGSSGELARQIRAGAPMDGVYFAGAKPVDDLIKDGRADQGTRRVFATNALVLVGPKGAKPLTFATLDQIPAGEKLAVGDPASVPVGQYSKTALTALGVWDKVQDRLVLAADVTAALTYARRGEVAAAIVYRTDAMGVKDIEVLEEAKAPWAPTAEYVAAVVTGGDKGAAETAARFQDFVLSGEGKAVLAKYGFGTP